MQTSCGLVQPVGFVSYTHTHAHTHTTAAAAVAAEKSVGQRGAVEPEPEPEQGRHVSELCAHSSGSDPPIMLSKTNITK